MFYKIIIIGQLLKETITLETLLNLLVVKKQGRYKNASHCNTCLVYFYFSSFPISIILSTLSTDWLYILGILGRAVFLILIIKIGLLWTAIYRPCNTVYHWYISQFINMFDLEYNINISFKINRQKLIFQKEVRILI